jgi:TRAP transporter TAXI family solute receptor
MPRRSRGPSSRWSLRRRVSREHLYLYGPAVVLTLVGFLVALHFVEPAPPRRVVMATGGQDGAYYQLGLRYQKLLAEEGIQLDVRATAGAVENVRLLKDPARGVDVAFVQGGVLAAEDADHLRSLGTMYLEPIWVFSRAELTGLDIAGLAGKRVAVGPDGSGTRALAELLLNANGITPAAGSRVPVSGQAAKEALEQRRVDAAFFVASVQAPVLQEIARRRDLRLMSFDRADAYTRQFPFLFKVVLPRGGLSLASDAPSRDVVLLAAAASLVIRADFHPALADLFLMSATRIHARPGLFEQARQFPSPDHVDVPLSPEARRYYEKGPPLLTRYLPFWMATLADRLKVMLVPLIALMLPLFKIVPPLYRWRVRSKVYRWYHDLDAIDHALATREAAADLGYLHDDLDRVESEVRQVTVPPSYRDNLYHLRAHIDLLRTKVQAVRRG